MSKVVKKKRKKKRKRRIKKKIKFMLCIVAIALIGYMVHIVQGNEEDSILANSNDNGRGVITADSEVEEVEKVEEVDPLEGIPDHIKTSSDPIIQNLISNISKHPEAKTILSNFDTYPTQLLELATKKEETISFVANYIDRDQWLNKDISIKKDYKRGSIPLFMQWDERWGYEEYGTEFLAISGCGPTALAMVAVGLTGDTSINPKVVAQFSEQYGYAVDGVGSSWTLMTEGAYSFGIIGEELPLSENSIISTLKNGQPIIASMGPGTFTSTGHFIVLTGVDDNNRIIVNDSDSKIRSNETWDVSVFMNEANNLWSFSAF